MDDIVDSLGLIAPQVYWGTPRRNVELTDLLVVVTRRLNRLPATRYAILLQGKCVERPDRPNAENM
jgi:hypothetical protein